MTTLLRDVIDIAERAGAEDYVLRLTDSVDADHLAQTLDDYVVTPALGNAFDQALSLVGNALQQGVSRAAFLTGSFGSGKSHFMAVLHALLRQNSLARSKVELQQVIVKHDPVLQNRKVLPLTFHLLAARSMEQAIFDAYLKQVKALHPEAVLPALHESAQLFVDAQNLRRSMGDPMFFSQLNAGGGSDDPWAAVLGSTTWDSERFDAARSAAPGDTARQELVTALVDRFYSSYTRRADYVDLDTGLAAISAHARGLGYDAVVLFLDEVVLWLAFGVRDLEFFRRESQKLTKLVESGGGVRPIPLVSFVARQMDLRQWFADSGASGAQQEALDQAFRHQAGRFAVIELGDDNLAHVANRRLLRPKDDQAQQLLDDAFSSLDRRPEVWDVLLDGVNTDDRHRGSDEAAFRRTYPFSPALVSTLRSLASVMQRERTALKVMQQMLVDRRDTLTIDDVIPVGDAFDYVVAGGEVLDAQAAALFRSANTLYAEKLRPLLLDQYHLTQQDLESGASVPPALLADERLAKTLLLSAVAPNVPSLKGLTAGRLASLNHGSITSPLPNNEATVVTGKVREWARRIPEIKIGGEARNPIIQVLLADVDYESIVERARIEGNDGRLRELIKRLVAENLNVDLGPQDGLGTYLHRFVWRGSQREVDLIFGNVRDASWLPDDAFQARPNTWRFVIDHPFDEPGHSTAEDRARLDRLLYGNVDAHTVVWLPRFFSESRMLDARRLVILNYLLENDAARYPQYADHLSEPDRVQARAILESQRASLKHTLDRAIQVAYDAESPTRADDVVIDAGHDEVILSLSRGFSPQPPVAATLEGAFGALLDQAFSATYPGHPGFEPGDVEVTKRELLAVHNYVVKALADPDHRVPLEGPEIAAVRRVANPLGVGWAAETHFLMGDDRFIWGQEFERALGLRGADDQVPVTVGEVRGWIEAVTPPKGLRTEVADLVILAWAELRQRSWYSHGAPIPTPKPGELRPEMELRVQPMPTNDEWRKATIKAGGLFGIAAGAYITPTEVASFAQKVKDAVTAVNQPAYKLVTAIAEARSHLGLAEASTTGRLATAEATAGLCEQLRQLSGLDLIRRLADAPIDQPAIAGRSLATASDVTAALNGFDWSRLAPLKSAAEGEGTSADKAATIIERVRTAVESEEFTTGVAAALRQADRDIFDWLRAQIPAPRPTPPGATPTPPPTPATAAGKRRLRAGEPVTVITQEIEDFRREHEGREVTVEWRLEE